MPTYKKTRLFAGNRAIYGSGGPDLSIMRYLATEPVGVELVGNVLFDRRTRWTGILDKKSISLAILTILIYIPCLSDLLTSSENTIATPEMIAAYRAAQ